MQIIQIIAIVFVLFAFTRVLLQLRASKISPRSFIFWTVIWVVIIIATFLPGVASFFARIVGIGRGLDLALYISIIILFYLIFKLYVKLEKIEQDITKVVRNIAIKKK